MAKRKRRASTASVEDIAKVKEHRFQDLDVLKRINPKLEDSNEWPVFVLEDATIFNKDGRTLENALFVEQDGPFMARGRLLIEEDDQRALLRPPHRNQTSLEIEIQDCQKYSIGLSEDNRPVIWISGPSGWFEIEPSPQYSQLYRYMCEAVSLFYHVTDIHECAGRKQPPLDEVLLKYAVKIGDGSVKEDVMNRCQEFASFLVDHIHAGKDSKTVSWEKSSFFQMLVGMKSAPKVSKPSTPKDVVNRPSIRKLPTRTKCSNPGVKSLSLAPDNIGREAASASSQAALSHPSGEPFDPFPAIVTLLDDSFENKYGYNVTVASIGDLITLNFKMAHGIKARDVLHYYAADLMQLPQMQRWIGSALYEWLEEMALTPWVPSSELSEPIIIAPRRRHSKNRSASTTSSDAIHEINRKKVKGRLSGKGAILRLASSSPSNLAVSGVDHFGLQSDCSPPPKRSGVQPRWLANGTSEMRTTADSLQGSADWDNRTFETNTPDLAGSPLASGQPRSEDRFQVIIRSEPLPSALPLGHNNTWACEEPGCCYIVRGGDDATGQQEIWSHFRDHQNQNERIELLKFESKGRLPINHLLEKIKRAAKHSAEQPSLMLVPTFRGCLRT